MPTWVVLVIVAVVVLLVAGLVVSLQVKKRSERNRARAGELRAEAAGQVGSLAESQLAADQARVKADLARAEARHVEEQAAAAASAHRDEQSTYESQLREADRLDPDVNTRAKDYQPSVWDDASGDVSLPDPADRTATDAAGGADDDDAGTPKHKD